MTINITETVKGLAKISVRRPSRVRPAITAGSDARTKSPTVFSALGSRPKKPWTSFHIRRLNTVTTAIKVPKCTITSKVTSPVLMPSIACPNAKWPELLTGRNSVKPWTIPSSAASRYVIIS